jgi:hypothetical protein
MANQDLTPTPAHDPFQAIAPVIADLRYSHPASHTRQCAPVNPRRESPTGQMSEAETEMFQQPGGDTLG